MALIGAGDSRVLCERFARLDRPVRLLVFTTQDAHRHGALTEGLAAEVAALSDYLSVETIDLDAQPERGAPWGVDKAPAIALLVGSSAIANRRSSTGGADDADRDFWAEGLRDTGIRFFGLPAGYEFASLVDAILAASRAEPKLTPATAGWLASLDRPLHLQVFVTPTCPYCPRAVTLAHRLALASPHVRADMVEATEFPELAERYDVLGVPRTVINDAFAVDGAVPEDALLGALREAVTGAA